MMIKKTKKVFIISIVRNASNDLESNGCEVHSPHRNTIQSMSVLGICTQNLIAIKDADEVHIFYNSKSIGTHFDIGMAFALQKRIVVVENEKHDENNKKSFSTMLSDWNNLMTYGA